MTINLKKSALEEMVWKSIRFTMADNSFHTIMCINNDYRSSAKYETMELFPRIYKVNSPMYILFGFFDFPREKLFALAAKNNDILDTVLEVPYLAHGGGGVRCIEETYNYLGWASKTYNTKATAHTHPGSLKFGLYLSMPSEEDIKWLKELKKRFHKEELYDIIIANTSYYAIEVWSKYFPLDNSRGKVKVPKPEPRYLRSLTNEAFHLWLKNFNESPSDFLAAYDLNRNRIDLKVI